MTACRHNMANSVVLGKKEPARRNQTFATFLLALVLLLVAVFVLAPLAVDLALDGIPTGQLDPVLGVREPCVCAHGDPPLRSVEPERIRTQTVEH
jgi:hypothetical protein